MNLFNVHGQRLLKTGGNIFINLRTIEEYIFDTGNSETVKTSQISTLFIITRIYSRDAVKVQFIKEKRYLY